MRWFLYNANLVTKLRILVGVLATVTLIATILSEVNHEMGLYVGLIGSVVVFVGGIFIANMISEPFRESTFRTQGLAEDDLQSPINNTDREDCVGVMSRAMVRFRDTALEMRQMVEAVNEGAQGIRTGSHEIAQASEDLARRTEANAATLQETSSSLNEIDERLKASAKSAQTTVRRADEAIHSVRDGRTIADEAVQAMGRVSESAKGIDNVIEGLDKIAFQTRVLAMNAAVEAGRAGEAGRGFAVVADLVSALAMRAEEEAQTARDQLTVTQADIGTAVEAVTRVDNALESINDGVGEVHQLVGSMAADNQAQSSAVTEISGALSLMDEATQQNAAMVEETSAAARNLLNEVDALSATASTATGTSTPASKSISRPRPSISKPIMVKKSGKSSEAPYVSPVPALSGGSSSASDQSGNWADF